MTKIDVLVVSMADGSTWAVPVEVIARDRANHYKHEFDGDAQRSYDEDTAPLFEAEEDTILDWAAGNMDWVDVRDRAYLLVASAQPDTRKYQDGWMNGQREIRRQVLIDPAVTQTRAD